MSIFACTTDFYCSSVLVLTKKDCNEIMSPILGGGLPKIGVCRTIARELVYTPTKFQGLGIKDLYISQGLSHVKILLDHIWQRTTTGKLLCATIEYLKIEVGLRGSILRQSFDTFGHLAEKSWISHLWKFLSETGIQIPDKIKDFSLVRENDRTINKLFAEAYPMKKISKADWVKANKCRIYLEVLTLGDIASADGTAIEDEIIKGVFVKSRVRKIDLPFQ